MILQLAQREVTGGWNSEWWPKESTIPLEVFAVIFGVLGVFLAIRAAMWLIRRARAKARPLMLFNRVARQLGVAAGDRWWLWRVARRSDLDSPITLMLSSATLEHHAAAAGGDADSPRGRSMRMRSLRLGQMLFGRTPDRGAGESTDTPVSDSDGA